jgi:hypothetical protein
LAANDNSRPGAREHRDSAAPRGFMGA